MASKNVRSNMEAHATCQFGGASSHSNEYTVPTTGFVRSLLDVAKSMNQEGVGRGVARCAACPCSIKISCRVDDSSIYMLGFRADPAANLKSLVIRL